jgi:hypothetical protein
LCRPVGQFAKEDRLGWKCAAVAIAALAGLDRPKRKIDSYKKTTYFNVV